MNCQTTFQTMMPPLRESFLFPMSAKTGLTCVIWIDFYQFSIGAFCLIFQLLKKAIPSYIEYLLCKDSFAHSENVQIFNRNHIKVFDNSCRNFMGKIVSLILYLSVNFAKLQNRFSSSVRACGTRFARYASLRDSQTLLRIFKILEILNLFTVGKRHKVFDSRINADGFTCFR